MCVQQRAPVCEGNVITSQREDRERARTVLDSRSFRGRVSGEWKDEGPAGTKTKL